MAACFEHPFRPHQIAEAAGADPHAHSIELLEENMRALEDAITCGAGALPWFIASESAICC